MHSRKLNIDDKNVTLTFGHEGVLYKSSFIMYDKRTNSKWNHSTGLAMVGPLAGRTLNRLPSHLSRWKEWKKRHPETKVLLSNKRLGFKGSYIGGKNPESIGLSVGRGPRAKLYPFRNLLNQKVINDANQGRPVLVTIDQETHQTFVYYRRIDDRNLTFVPANSTDQEKSLMKDQETGTLWNRSTGRAIQGKLKGTKLTNTVGVTWMIPRWKDIYENGTIYRTDEVR